MPMTIDLRSEPVAIAVAPNGGTRTKADHPALPLSPIELAETALQCLEAGAAMIHVHVRRRRDGRHLLDSTAFREALGAIRKRIGDNLVVQITTEALGIYPTPEQIAVLKVVRPEAASLALREFVTDQISEAVFADLLAWMKRERVIPQIILFEPSESEVLADMQRRGLIPWDDIPLLYVLGRYTPGQISHPADLLPFLAPGRPRFRHWSACTLGGMKQLALQRRRCWEVMSAWASKQFAFAEWKSGSRQCRVGEHDVRASLDSPRHRHFRWSIAATLAHLSEIGVGRVRR